MSASTWEQRMASRAAQRAATRAAEAQRVREEEEAAAKAAYERELGPNPCGVCYVLARDLWIPDRWEWTHVWPAGPIEPWVCEHACHGPDGEYQVPVAIG